MNGVIYYYSNTGNTRLAMEYMAKRMQSVTFTLVDITVDPFISPDTFDLAGFATYADFLSPPDLIRRFIRKLPHQNNKPAFIFNSYGNLNAGTLAHLHRCVGSRGFTIIAAHALQMPANNVPLRCMGIVNEQAPDTRQMERFDTFISNLDKLTATGGSVPQESVMLPLKERIWPSFPRWLGKWQMGPKFVDAAACTRCGLCARGCPYGAIRMDDLPRFTEPKCAACWRCYNRCPTRAIYTRKYRGRGHYPAPLPAVREKLEFRTDATPEPDRS